MAGLTPFQTVGPYLHLGLLAGREPMTSPEFTMPVVIEGRLLDGEGIGIGDGALEFWAPGFDRVGRVWTDADGQYRLVAVKPRTRVDPTGAVHAPHFAVRVLARGILTEYLTRVYFDDEPDNADDSILRLVPEDRRATLIAAASASAEYHLDIVVQGERETVFFDV
jgi:protocatechuate 3,4-dioxygenase, alpha subunit